MESARSSMVVARAGPEITVATTRDSRLPGCRWRTCPFPEFPAGGARRKPPAWSPRPAPPGCRRRASTVERWAPPSPAKLRRAGLRARAFVVRFAPRFVRAQQTASAAMRQYGTLLLAGLFLAGDAAASADGAVAHSPRFDDEPSGGVRFRPPDVFREESTCPGGVTQCPVRRSPCPPWHTAPAR